MIEADRQATDLGMTVSRYIFVEEVDALKPAITLLEMRDVVAMIHGSHTRHPPNGLADNTDPHSGTFISIGGEAVQRAPP